MRGASNYPTIGTGERDHKLAAEKDVLGARHRRAETAADMLFALIRSNAVEALTDPGTIREK